MNITDRPVAVLAGTPVDTEMGAEVLRRHGLEPLCCPVSRTPPEQAAFQKKKITFSIWSKFLWRK